MTKHIVTRESLQSMLDQASPEKRAAIIGRALLVVFRNQTETEQSANTTNVDNGIGFTGADARSGTLTAKYFMKHQTLADWQVERWMKPGKAGFARLTKYWKQLDAAAQQKAKM